MAHPLSRAGLVGPVRVSLAVAIGLGLVTLLSLFVDPRRLAARFASGGAPAKEARGRAFRTRRGWPTETLESLVDAVIPAEPETGVPGAREAGAVELLAHGSIASRLGWPAGAYLRAAAFVADLAAVVARGRSFRCLDGETRSRLFGVLLRILPGLYFPILAAANLAFVGGLGGDSGLAYLGMPGAVPGFDPGPGTGDWEPRSLTASGNLP